MMVMMMTMMMNDGAELLPSFLPSFLLNHLCVAGGETTRMQLLMLNVSLGYFAFDTIAWILNGIYRNK